MSTLLYIVGALAAVICGGTLTIATSAIHEILSAIAGLCAIVACGLAAIVDRLDKLNKAAATIDQNTWTVGKSIWRQLHDPTAKNPEPKADGD